MVVRRIELIEKKVPERFTAQVLVALQHQESLVVGHPRHEVREGSYDHSSLWNDYDNKTRRRLVRRSPMLAAGRRPPANNWPCSAPVDAAPEVLEASAIVGPLNN